MTRALFVTTATSEPGDNVRAWNRWTGEAIRVTFDLDDHCDDEMILAVAREYQPDVILYTGGVAGPGMPRDETLLALRNIAPSIISQGDMSDPPWHPLLERYRRIGAFDLYVSMDGGGPVDHHTLTPIDIDAFDGPPVGRDIPCGFAGNHAPREHWETVLRKHGTEDLRSGILHRMAPLVTLRNRELQGDYRDFATWLRRCRMVFNTSWAGSELAHHMKGRVLEAAFAGAALLEPEESPIDRWFPRNAIFRYKDLEHAKAIIQHTPADAVLRAAEEFSIYARAHYHPKRVFEGMLKALKEKAT